MAKSKKEPVDSSAETVVTDTYRTLAVPSRGLYKEKGSKFLAFAYPVENEDQVRACIEVLHKEYFDARHHCYAYVLGLRQEIYRTNDDGEPSATAGRPIHGQILSRGLTNVLVVVVRYFGGTKLGTSGLIHAYKTAALDALQQAEVVEKIVMKRYLVKFPYERMNQAMRIVKDLQLQILSQDAGLECTLHIAVRLSGSDRCYGKFVEERFEIRESDGSICLN